MNVRIPFVYDSNINYPPAVYIRLVRAYDETGHCMRVILS